ncbi:MAG TPA: nucleoside recognition protein [Clostridiaceae bacterium]|jgi:Fe2+ transport system protein B|nr:nucleoside recognition protein [Clostridiaceae bacterium]HBG38396.1 nucleoside recognition protein [Clostridiaceae bacterium]HBN27513.1 nucleoside recognition protein [Clostridiaceae bacterium]HBX48416.1 nucleoside recognition protein [Clostridiaceae bacterium]HCL51544.1 nucleoside recognition protein [Clostridiaceae bacterium]
MSIIAILKEALLGSLSSMWTVVKIVVPLMIAIEIIKDLNMLEKIANFLKPLTRFLGTSKYSIIPLLSGLFFGLLYGAGIIIDSVNEGNMKKREVNLVIIFLASCHAIFEDTLLFTEIGANGWLILFSRLFAAFLVTFLASKTKYFKDDNVNMIEVKNETGAK